MYTYTVICDHCKQPFERELKQRCKDQAKHRQHLFCSKKCFSLFHTLSIETQCGNCNKQVSRRPKEIKSSKSGKVFCCQSCAASHNNRLKRKSRRSKCEKKLFDMLVQEFPNLDFLANDKSMLGGLEADIAIPSLKLAIEWNGIVHFKPIYGLKKFNRIQQIDAQKRIIAQQNDINLIVIPDLVSTDAIIKQAFGDIKDIIHELLTSLMS